MERKAEDVLIPSEVGQERNQPPRCVPEVYQNGVVYAVVAGPRSWALEDWKNEMQHQLPKGTKIDWHFVGGRAVFKAVGDPKAARDKLEEMLNYFESNPVGRGGYPLQVLSIYTDAEIEDQA